MAAWSPDLGRDAGGLLAMMDSGRSNRQSGKPILLARPSIYPSGASLTDRSLVNQFRFAGGAVSQDSPGAEFLEHTAGCQSGLCPIDVSFASKLHLARSPKSHNTHACV